MLSCLLTGCAHMAPPYFDGGCPHEFPVKGNMDSSIYHTPRSPYYSKTNAEICFDSPAAAKYHGFTAPKG
jgi:hypothetical protein